MPTDERVAVALEHIAQRMASIEMLLFKLVHIEAKQASEHARAPGIAPVAR
jgi:hypothetical protein